MRRQCNESNYSFLIETLTPAGERLMFWRIDQSCRNPYDGRVVDELTNTIEKYLSHLNKITGLDYGCFGQGPTEEVDQLVKSRGIEVH